MNPEPVYVSRYEQRVKLVQDVLKGNTPLSAEESRALAMKLLRTLDRIPEKVR
ncbi:DUF6307 family protein [Lentzea terrae]|uniref:DUF6307 family protein n=1 Tax=Lentzea terrae TaxID=2200761 RepID=UPI0018E4FA2A|nr:DUF6307 family protein [Lentzea terrae]